MLQALSSGLQSRKHGTLLELIDEQGMSYEEIMRKIGSKTPTVRQHYISFRVLLQMENELEDFSLKMPKVDSVLCTFPYARKVYVRTFILMFLQWNHEFRKDPFLKYI